LQSPTNFSQKNAATLASIPPEEMTPTHHELKRFAEEFKAKRIQLGYTQGAVGLSLSEKGYSNFAQSTISRFEQMQLSPSNASAIMVVLKRWLYEAENPDAVSSTSADPLGPPRKRKKRVVYTPQSLKILNKWFEDEPRPNRQIIETVAQELDLQPEEVRVWFCNKRQKQKMSGNDIDDDCDELSPAARSTPSPPQTKFTIEELSKSSSSSTTTNMIASPLSFSSQLTVSPTLRPMIFSTNSRHSVNLPYNFMSTKA
jgi:class 6 POU domain transcription factor